MPQAIPILHVDDRYLSPYALSVFVALREKGIQFQMNAIDLEARAHQSREFSRLSVTRRVPTLQHRDFALSESSAITEYLEELYPGQPLYPQARTARARARQLQAWLRSDLMPIRMERSTDHVFLKVSPKPLSDKALAAAAQLYDAVDELLPRNAENLFGSWCLADTDLAIMINRLAHSGDAVPPHIAAYAQRQWQRAPIPEWCAMARERAAA